jgi:hypothetical protein
MKLFSNKILTPSPLNINILASDFLLIKIVGLASVTQIRVALPNSDITRTSLRITLRLTATSNKPIRALRTALTKLLTKIAIFHALAVGFSASSRMITRRIIDHVIRWVLVLHLQLFVLIGEFSELPSLFAGRGFSVGVVTRNILDFPLRVFVHLLTGLEN